MKAYRLISMILLAVMANSCCSLFNINCDECEEEQRGVELADLLLEDFESVLIPDDQDSSVAYNVIHTILNFASEFDCPEVVADAGTHNDRLELIYSETEDFSDPVLVEAQDAEVSKNTGPDENYSVVSEIQFERAGFYKIDNTIDSSNSISERDETNNNDVNTIGAELGRASVDNSHVIHITPSMVSGKKDDKAQRYISKWEIRVE